MIEYHTNGFSVFCENSRIHMLILIQRKDIINSYMISLYHSVRKRMNKREIIHE